MIGGVTCCRLPHLPGVPHLYVNRPYEHSLDKFHDDYHKSPDEVRIQNAAITNYRLR